ncbi:hypothetical protein BJX66DRAFT_121593 [Aspergillus keveii]|uniref:Ubiquitin-like protease family profile domain-containing protein n=1 Tax=Aspergillus keveii TaxID=714993 RepID=A0ABR4FKE8_9EURO
MGASQQDKVTILNMLEYMGAWQWYDSQVEHAKGTTQTKKKKQVGRRGAAIAVMNRIQEGAAHCADNGSWMRGVGRITLEEDECGLSLMRGGESITARQRELQRRRIHMQLSRGQKLCTQIVGKLGLGILFDQKIWKYTKSSIANIDNMVKRILEDKEHKKLLDILEPQLKLLIEEGTPDLAAFFENLVDSRLVTDNELRELQVEFPLESRSLPDATLDTAIDHLVELVSTKVLNKATPESGDTVAINGSVELSCEIFNRLRPGEWLDSWTIMALMQISDRPAFVKYDLSIPLDESGSDGQIRPIKRPLASWAKKIAQHRREAKDDFGEACPLVYFCPINHGNKHFTLLEINERKQVICHYDSMADSNTILGVKESRLAGLVRGEFKNLRYSYIEVPTPQQAKDDDWSCGIRVVWNFRQLANDLPIREQDPKLMALEMVEGLQASVEDRTMIRYKRRHRVK